ncbi:MAG: nucleoside deaminase, partial [Chloroflexota bacterium]
MREIANEAPAPAERLLLRSIEIGREGMLARRGGPFGALIATADGSIVAEGCNEVTSTNDPTAHAEVLAIRRACAALGTFILAGHVMYTSCEPCPMCLAAAYWARLDAIVFAASRVDAAAGGFDDEFLYRELVLPMDARSLPVSQAASMEGAELFAEWLR